MFFDSWTDVGHIIAKGLLSYILIIIAVRIGGKRSTSKMNNFDWIVTVALGSIAGSTVLVEEVSLVDGAAAAAVLLSAQFLFTASAARWPWVNKLLRAEPTLLLFRGCYLHDAMLRERVTEAEIVSAVRERGIADISTVWAVVLEADAELSVIDHSQEHVPPVLASVKGAAASDLQKLL